MSEFEALYYRRPAVLEFEATVVSCEERHDKKGKVSYEVVLSDTAFYPEGGGQPADGGVLFQGDLESAVFDVQKKENKIVHTVNKSFVVGSTVTGKIDRDRRRDHTENHTGEHILSGLIHDKFGYENVGFHMSEDVITIDFDGPLTWEELLERETEANRIVREDLPIHEVFPDDDALETLPYRSKKELTGEVRLIEIPGADLCACCGTHLSRTGEVGLIKCLSIMNYKGGSRIEMVCGRKALLAMQERTDREIAISRLLSTKQEKNVSGVEALLAEQQNLKKEANDTKNRYFALREKILPNECNFLLVFEEEAKSTDIRRFCDQLLKADKAPTVAVLSGTEENYSYCIGSRTVALQDLAKELNQKLNGRGGGSDQMIQGSFHASRKEIEEVLSQIFDKE